jgi:hypothetical protein
LARTSVHKIGYMARLGPAPVSPPTDKRRSYRPPRPAAAFAAWFLLSALSLGMVATASARPLDGVAATVAEVTAPVGEAVETVAPPGATPPIAPASSPPAAEDESAAGPPSERTKHGVEAVTGAGKREVAINEEKAAGPDDTVSTVSQGAPHPIQELTGSDDGDTTRAPLASSQSHARGGDANPGVTPRDSVGLGNRARSDASPRLSEALQAAIWRPFIKVWQAVVVSVAQLPLDGSFNTWAPLVLAGRQESRAGSVGGEAPAASGRDQGMLGQAVDLSSTSSAHGPAFPWGAGNGGLAAWFLLVLGAAMLAIVLLVWHEFDPLLFSRRFGNWRR